MTERPPADDGGEGDDRGLDDAQDTFEREIEGELSELRDELGVNDDEWGDADEFEPAPREEPEPAPEPEPAAEPAPEAADPKLARLKELGALRDSGVLTEAEFATLKQQIISGE